MKSIKKTFKNIRKEKTLTKTEAEILLVHKLRNGLIICKDQ